MQGLTLICVSKRDPSEITRVTGGLGNAGLTMLVKQTYGDKQAIAALVGAIILQ